MSHESSYGLWSLVFILVALGFAKPQRSRDWRSFGAFSALILAPTKSTRARSLVGSRECGHGPRVLARPCAPMNTKGDGHCEL